MILTFFPAWNTFLTFSIFLASLSQSKLQASKTKFSYSSKDIPASCAAALVGYKNKTHFLFITCLCIGSTAFLYIAILSGLTLDNSLVLTGVIIFITASTCFISKREISGKVLKTLLLAFFIK